VLVHNAALLGLQVDTLTLFRGESPDYELWLGSIVDQLNATNRAAEERAKAGR
jgi:hypothetical protein